MNDTTTTSVINNLLAAISNDAAIWSPVIIAWALSFLINLAMRKKRMQRYSDRELHIYAANFIIAAALYAVFNRHNTGVDVLQQSLFAGAIAVLLPLFWFRRIASQQKLPYGERRVK